MKINKDKHMSMYSDKDTKYGYGVDSIFLLD